MHDNLSEAIATLFQEHRVTELIWQSPPHRLLSRFDARPHRNLSLVTSALLANVMQMAANPSSVQVEDFALFNNSALVLSQHGSSNLAESLCRVGATFAQKKWAASGDPRWGAQMVQPAINAGRLAGLVKDGEKACKTYEDLYLCATGCAACHIEGLEVDATDLRTFMEAESGLEMVIRNAFIFDSLRALLISDDAEAACNFIARIRRDHLDLEPRELQTLDEVECRAYGRLGLWELSFKYGREMLRKAMTTNGSVIPSLCLLIRALENIGNRQERDRLLAVAHQQLPSLHQTSDKAAFVACVLTLEVAAAEGRNKFYEECANSLERARALAHLAQDEVLTLRCSSLAMSLSHGDPARLMGRQASMRAIATVRDLCEKSDYRAECLEAHFQVVNAASLCNAGGTQRHLLRLFALCSYCPGLLPSRYTMLCEKLRAICRGELPLHSPVVVGGDFIALYRALVSLCEVGAVPGPITS